MKCTMKGTTGRYDKKHNEMYDEKHDEIYDEKYDATMKCTIKTTSSPGPPTAFLYCWKR